MLFAVRTAWVVILFVLAAVLVVWFVVRIVRDVITWVKDEMFDEFRDLRKQADEDRKAKRKTQNEQKTPDEQKTPGQQETPDEQKPPE